MEYWDIGILGYWDIGIVGNWDIGVLEYWDIGILGIPGWAGIPRAAVAAPGSLECPNPGWTLGLGHLGTVESVPAHGL